MPTRIRTFDASLHPNLLSAFDYALRRWYDEEETIFEAMEYLRISPVEVQKELAFDIIEYLEVSAV